MRSLLEESFRAAVAAADPLQILAPHLPPPPKGRTFVAAAGKAAASMAAAVERNWKHPLEGIAITRYGHVACPPGSIQPIRARARSRRPTRY
jgi:hydroxypyruvate reductase